MLFSQSPGSKAACSAASSNHLSSLPSAAIPISSFLGLPLPALGAGVLPLRLQSWLLQADTLIKKSFYVLSICSATCSCHFTAGLEGRSEGKEKWLSGWISFGKSIVCQRQCRKK